MTAEGERHQGWLPGSVTSAATQGSTLRRALLWVSCLAVTNLKFFIICDQGAPTFSFGNELGQLHSGS